MRYLLFFAVIISAFSGCTCAPPVADISEVGLSAHNGLARSSFSVTFLADGTASCECEFYEIKEGNKPRIENPEPLCGHLYRNNASAFITERKRIGISKYGPSDEVIL